MANNIVVASFAAIVNVAHTAAQVEGATRESVAKTIKASRKSAPKEYYNRDTIVGRILHTEDMLDAVKATLADDYDALLADVSKKVDMTDAKAVKAYVLPLVYAGRGVKHVPGVKPEEGTAELTQYNAFSQRAGRIRNRLMAMSGTAEEKAKVRVPSDKLAAMKAWVADEGVSKAQLLEMVARIFPKKAKAA